MLNPKRHNTILIRILIEIYKDPSLRSILGFKGGTAALVFYDLPRFSVDLDFDLLVPSKKDEVFEKMKIVLQQFGTLREATDKQYTLFYILQYEKGQRNLKIDISKRLSVSEYEIKEYLGVSMLVMKQDHITAGKLAALITRKRFASRDMFDLWYFLKNNWKINESTLQDKTGLPVKKAIEKAINVVSHVIQSEMLSGLGELLDNKQKDWVRNHLKDELILQLRIYL